MRPLPAEAWLKLLYGLLCLYLVIGNGRVHALEPDEVVLVVNTEGDTSRIVANYYAGLRGIPAANIVEIATEPIQTLSEGTIRQKDYVAQIWEPVQATLRARGLEQKILAWIYSTDFPIAVNTSPPMSLNGFTFARGQSPSHELIKNGTYASPLFAGPLQAGGKAVPGFELSHLRNIPMQRRPIPSMMLGVTGARGNSLTEIFRYLRSSALADSSCPAGSVFLVDSKDLRVTMRRWQFEAAIEELKGLGQSARIIPGGPGKKETITGILLGTAQVPYALACEPGSYAGHLTSMAAHFDSPGQTKCTHWLRAGAAMTTGTVSEPHSIWTKFPNARIFAHSRRGLTAIEALYASVASPMQLLMLGDPLSKPYGAASAPRQIAIPEFPATASASAGPWTPAQVKPKTEGGIKVSQGKAISWSPKVLVDVALFESADAMDACQVVFEGQSARFFSDRSFAGIVFNCEGPENFRYFGLHGFSGAWVMARYDGKGFQIETFRAEPIPINQSYHLSLSHESDELLGRVDGRVVCRLAGIKEAPGKMGLLSGQADRIRYSKPTYRAKKNL